MSDTEGGSSGAEEPQMPPQFTLDEMIKYTRMDFAGVIITALGFGIYLVIAFASLQLLLKRKTSSTGRTITIAYTVVMLVLSSVVFGTSTRSNTILLVDSRFRPELSENLYCSPTNIATGAISSIQIWGNDALLLYRTYVILDGNWLFMIIPILTYLSVIGVGIAANLPCASKQMGGVLNLSPELDLATPFYSLTIGLNILTTLLIGVKLMSYRARVSRAGARGNDALRDLTSVLGILIESAAIYSLSGIVYLALYLRNNPLSSPFSNVFGAMTSIGPALIILRVALGVAYKRGASSGGGSSQTLRGMESGEPRTTRNSHTTTAHSIPGSTAGSPYGYEKQHTSDSPSGTYEMVSVPLAPNRRPDYS